MAAARENAIEAGVEEQIRFCRADVNRLIGSPGQAGPAGKDLWHSEEAVVFVTNLPYAIRIGTTEELERIYRTLGEMMKREPTWNLFVITADRQAEAALGRKADRRRKLYNGNIETTYYQYHGERKR